MLSSDLGEDFLEHYGKKGMHWGIRNEPIKPVVDVFPLKKTRQTARMFISGYRMYKMYKVVRGFTQKIGPITAFHENNTPVWQNTLVSDIS